jgi:hypothetical protein
LHPVKRGFLMAVYELDGVAPQIDETAWVADSAQVIGRVAMGAQASVWFGTVVRGDTRVDHHRRRKQHPGRLRAARRRGQTPGGGRAT